jgi:ABC-2 type transport system ATP-binding protein
MITVTELRKSYGDIDALKGISFEVPKGQVVGFLGPNGAGKSTTMKILTGFMAPTSGSVTIDGIDAFADPVGVKARIGYLPESTPLYQDMIVYDYLDYVAEMRGIASSARHGRILEIARLCGASKFIGQEIGTLSKGQKQRTGLAQALIHDPPIVILDEPTSGLDPNQIVEIRALIRELGKNRTIILSTHNLPEVMQTCDRLLIIHEGSIVEDGTPEEIESRRNPNPKIVLRVAAKNGAALEPGLARQQVSQVAGVQRVTADGGKDGVLSLHIDAAGGMDVRPDLYQLAVRHDWTLYELHRDVLDLEAIFRSLTQQR